MKKSFLLIIASVALVSCDWQGPNTSNNNNPNNRIENDRTRAQSEDSTRMDGNYYDSDNTGRNIRDRDSSARTSFDQSESEADRMITRRLRQIIISDDSLSTNAKNIKIITIEGVVTLRGPVASAQEKDAIAKKVKNIQGISRVDNQLEVTRDNK